MGRPCVVLRHGAREAGTLSLWRAARRGSVRSVSRIASSAGPATGRARNRACGSLAPVVRGTETSKTAEAWDGYKVHLTETCGPDTPNLVTNVATTVATVADRSMIQTIHTQLAARDCAPGEHWVDA